MDLPVGAGLLEAVAALEAAVMVAVAMEEDLPAMEVVKVVRMRLAASRLPGENGNGDAKAMAFSRVRACLPW